MQSIKRGRITGDSFAQSQSEQANDEGAYDDSEHDRDGGSQRWLLQ
jgi:hypothetical protein